MSKGTHFPINLACLTIHIYISHYYQTMLVETTQYVHKRRETLQKCFGKITLKCKGAVGSYPFPLFKETECCSTPECPLLYYTNFRPRINIVLILEVYKCFHPAYNLYRNYIHPKEFLLQQETKRRRQHALFVKDNWAPSKSAQLRKIFTTYKRSLLW